MLPYFLYEARTEPELISRAETVLGYAWTPVSVALISLSSILGIIVSLSTFLVISVTSSLTYTVIGHIKTLIVLACGVFLFGDAMDSKKLSGIAIAMVNPGQLRGRHIHPC